MLSEREKTIMLEAFTTGRIYTSMGEKENPVEIHKKLEENCEKALKMMGESNSAPDGSYNSAVAEDYRLLKELKPRAETGLMKFGDDWMGVFIRGDNALAFAYDLRELLENEINPLRKIRLEYYLELLLSVKQ